MSDETRAREALRALGITPTRQLIRQWILAPPEEEEEAVQSLPPPSMSPAIKQLERPPTTSQPYCARRPRGYSKSQLEPVLRDQGSLERKSGIRKRGRPRIVASWFEDVATIMADGTPLRVALRRIGITLDRNQIRAVYRNTEFRRKYQDCQKGFRGIA